MNLRRHAAVVRRFRFIVAGGLVLGILLGVLAVFKVSSTGLEWRSKEVWSSESRLYVTQSGFPDGRVILQEEGLETANPADAPSDGAVRNRDEVFADPGRFTNLAVTYAYFLQSDRVRSLIRPTPSPAQLDVQPVSAGMNSNQTLPILLLTTRGPDGARARALNASAIGALQAYLRDEQRRNGVDRRNRVRIEVLNPPSAGTIALGHSKTPAIVAFILTMAAALALAYCLDNLYPVPTGDEDAEATADPEPPATALEEVWPARTAAGNVAARRLD